MQRRGGIIIASILIVSIIIIVNRFIIIIETIGKIRIGFIIFGFFIAFLLFKLNIAISNIG